jgi:hypothetical protein
MKDSEYWWLQCRPSAETGSLQNSEELSLIM